MVSGEMGRPPVMLRMNAGTSSGFSGLPWARRRTASFLGMILLLGVTHHKRHREKLVNLVILSAALWREGSCVLLAACEICVLVHGSYWQPATDFKSVFIRANPWLKCLSLCLCVSVVNSCIPSRNPPGPARFPPESRAECRGPN